MVNFSIPGYLGNQTNFHNSFARSLSIHAQVIGAKLKTRLPYPAAPTSPRLRGQGKSFWAGQRFPSFMTVYLIPLPRTVGSFVTVYLILMVLGFQALN